ncbi:hypothetical protein EYZ11_006341 [Aspergillus tanneri]|uniref:CorA metal ion transporter n=1 Tax=Aspergillus tanneri TaxID=1220188 RepID=A0A4S3JI53_9EURO|nr:hypothetical protein EYZ11_006341 [Aspergillus tanneri]
MYPIEMKSPRYTFFTSQTQEAHVFSTWEDILNSKVLSHLTVSIKVPGAPVWWLDIRDATQRDVAVVSQALSIHPLTAEDIATRETREKVEVFRNYYLISFQTLVSFVNDDSESVDAGTGQGQGCIRSSTASSIPYSAEFYILVFNGGTVTFSPSGCGHMARVQDRIRRLHDPSILSSDWICYALIFEPHRQAAEYESEAIEDQVFIARVDDVKSLIPRVDKLRKKITHLTRCLSGKVDVLNGFVKRCQAKDKSPVFPDGEFILYLGDVQDHLVTTLQSLMHFDEIVSRSQSNCLAQLSANNLRLSLNINSVLSKVTVLATIFVPMHMMTGLFGMNVNVPGQEVDGLGWFFGIIGGMLSFMVIACSVAYKYKLL